MHLSKSLVVFLDEAVWGGDKKAEGKLKQLITEPTVMFEPKGIDSLALGNFINVIIASNEDWVIPATGDERRFLVLEPSEEFKQDTEYFRLIVDERNNGGAEAMMYDLLRHDFSGVNLRRAPITDGLCEQVEASLPTVLDFWHVVLERGYLLSDPITGGPVKTEMDVDSTEHGSQWPPAAFKFEIHNEYQRWCRAKNERYLDDEPRFWRDTWRIWDGGYQKKKTTTHKGQRIYVITIPELPKAQKAFTAATRIKFDLTEEETPAMEHVPYSGQF